MTMLAGVALLGELNVMWSDSEIKSVNTSWYLDNSWGSDLRTYLDKIYSVESNFLLVTEQVHTKGIFVVEIFGKAKSNF